MPFRFDSERHFVLNCTGDPTVRRIEDQSSSLTHKPGRPQRNIGRPRLERLWSKDVHQLSKPNARATIRETKPFASNDCKHDGNASSHKCHLVQEIKRNAEKHRNVLPPCQNRPHRRADRWLKPWEVRITPISCKSSQKRSSSRQPNDAMTECSVSDAIAESEVRFIF